MTFQVGEKVVYPNHGVGTIENISTRSFGAGDENFYLLRLLCNSMTVTVPFSHVTDVGLRKITKTGEISRILNYLATGNCKSSSDWKVRYRINSEKMRAGSLLEIAEVFKALLIIQQDKPLSFREKKMLDRARQMLVGEVSACRGVSESDASLILQGSLSCASLNLPSSI